jgi:hypothetical protein
VDCREIAIFQDSEDQQLITSESVPEEIPVFLDGSP